MARKYSGSANATNAASATVPMTGLVGAATTRLRLFDVIVGSDATPADAAAKYALQRCSARGTQTATWTPTILDPADAASVAVFDTTWSVNPTITALSTLLQWAQNQRATFRWVAAPDSELYVPATAGAGLDLMALVASATSNNDFLQLWME